MKQFKNYTRGGKTLKLRKVSKVLTLVLAGAMSMSPAAVMAEGDGSGEAVNLVMTWWGNQVRNERTQEVLDKY